MSNIKTIFQDEIKAGIRFQFGANWARFLEVIDEERIAKAEKSLKEMLGVEDLKGMRFLDIGSGSGLFSLVAQKIGAKVHSFDFDPQSVACTRELKRRYFLDDNTWVIEEASVLDRKYLAKLGQFDVVYSWGVLHHTGAMWQALENVTSLVAGGGRLFIAIYNDQGRNSVMWKRIKKIYCSSPALLKIPILWLAFTRLWGPSTMRDLLKGQPGRTWHNYGKSKDGSGRGMSPWRDVVDWVGGFPFEVAKPEQIFDFYRSKGFLLKRLKTCGGGLGCNEYVFKRDLI